jgi:carboxyl-terminal processing protease
MRKLILIISLIILLIGNILNAQQVPDSVYYNRLYYTGKVWGYVKYFHSEVAKGITNWDSVLIVTISDVKDNISNEDFNNSLLNMIDMAREMAIPVSPLPEVPDTLKYNLDLIWLNDAIFSDTVKSMLDTIKTRFRPQNNYYVGEAWDGGNPTFSTDAQFYEWGVDLYPSEEYRLLALFRYWNIINYFYPYKYIIDQNWDSILFEFIPKIVGAYDEISFHLSFLELTTRINDTHAFYYTNSEIIDGNIMGRYILPLTLKYLENETVITGVYTDNDEIKAGDIIKNINGADIYTLRDSLRRYVAGSNNSAIERNINIWILMGQNENVQMTIENSESQKDITISRNVNVGDYWNLILKTGPVWEILDTDAGKCGYVDMGRFQVNQIDAMFNDLWNTDGIIFDIRNSPQGTMWYMIRYLFNAPIHNVKITYPDIEYPGTLSWYSETVGWGDFSKTYNRTIVLLLDEWTQSQAEYTVMALEQHPKAIKIGSQTAGADGNISEVYLPGGIKTIFTGLGIFYPDYTETQRIGIIADIEVYPTIAGIHAGQDEVLEEALDHIPPTDIENDLSNQSHLPNTYLFQNYPNPFNPATRISYSLAKSGFVRLKIYNILGQEIQTLVNKFQKAGNYNIIFDAKNLASGVYFYQLKVGNDFQKTKKMLLMR